MLASTYFERLKALSDDELLSENDKNQRRNDSARANMMSARSLAESGDSDDLEHFTSIFDVENHKYQLSQDALIARNFVYREVDHVFPETGWYKKSQCSRCGNEVIGYSMCDDCWED